MANTTNYNWETPDDTDLVKDGAAAIRTLGSSIDTTTKNLNPETTLGDIAYRSSTSNTNTRLGIGTAGQVLTVASGVPSWATPTTGDIEGVTAGTGITGGGTSGTVTITNDMATTITAAGDIVVGTGSGTYDNLPIGTTGQILTADTTVSPYKVKWAAAASGGGMTLLSTTTLSGATTTITIDPTGYNCIAISIQGIDMSTGGDGAVISINNAGDTVLALTRFIGTTASTGGVANTTIAYQNGDDMDGSANNAGWINIYNPTSTTNWKPLDVRLGWVTNSGSNAAWIGGGVFKNNAAISSIVFSRAISATFSAGTVKVFGVK